MADKLEEQIRTLTPQESGVLKVIHDLQKRNIPTNEKMLQLAIYFVEKVSEEKNRLYNDFEYDGDMWYSQKIHGVLGSLMQKGIIGKD